MNHDPSRAWTHLPSLIGLGLVLLMTLAPAPRAHGQLGKVAQAMEPDFFTRDLLIFIEGLNLDETQAVIAEAIFDDYEQKFDAGSLQMKEEMDSISDDLKALRTAGDTDKVLELVVQPIQDWLVRRQELNDQLIENVRIILVPEQQELWTDFNRRLYRTQNLDEGRLSGERVDLFVVARDTSIDVDSEPAKALFTNYSIELDRKLRDRQKLIEGDPGNLLDVLKSRTDDPYYDVGNKKEVEKHRIRVRDTNDLYREEIASVLTPELAEAFRMEALRRGYSKIYRTTNAERVFNDALVVYDPSNNEGEKADADTYEAIWSLYLEFLGKLANLNSNLYETIRTSEPQLALIKIENSLRRGRGEEIVRPVDPVRALQQEKRELEREYIDRLRALLGDDDFAELNGAQRYMPPPSFDPNNPSTGDGDRLLQLQRPSGGGKGDLPKGGKPDGRPDAPAKGLGGGAGVTGGTGSQDD